jgi:hypothetical protein
MRGCKVIGRKVLVRTHSAGVHFGTLEECCGRAVRLSEARRLWRWSEANTLNEIALRGCGEQSRISEPVPEILLTEAIEVIPLSAAAWANLGRSRWKG